MSKVNDVWRCIRVLDKSFKLFVIAFFVMSSHIIVRLLFIFVHVLPFGTNMFHDLM
jgi:hypothetical protein